MIHCTNCGTDNLDGSHYCDECGAKLTPFGVQTPIYTREASHAEAGTGHRPWGEIPPRGAEQVIRRPSSIQEGASGKGEARETSAGGQQKPTVPVRPAPTGQQPRGVAPLPKAKLIIARGGRVGKEFPILDPESLLGRWDADRGIFPEIDLDEDDPEAKVSRRHARISYREGQFFIEDLGSTNGTFINRGARLVPGTPYPIRSGDEIIVGKTFLRFVIEEL